MLTTNQRLDENARKMILHAAVECGRDKLCKASGIAQTTYYNHVRKPEYVTLSELRVLSRLGKLSDKQILAAIRDE